MNDRSKYWIEIADYDIGTALEHAKRYAGIVCEELSPCKVVLFGSLVNGNFNENSDIDIAVVKDNLGENYWELSKKLNRLTRNIDTRIEPILLQADDDRSGFLTTVLTVGVELYFVSHIAAYRG